MIYFQSQVDQLLAAKDALIETLESEVLSLTEDLQRERIRANNAVDRLLQKEGSGAITPAPDRKEKDPVQEHVNFVAQIGQDVEIPDGK